MNTQKKPNKTLISTVLFIALFVAGEFKLINGYQSVANMLDSLMPIDGTPITSLFKVAYIITGALAFTNIVRAIISKIKPSSNRANTLLQLLHNAVSYVSIIVGLILALVALEVDVVGIATTVGILGIVVGFGAESLIADVFTGVCMIFEDQFNVGDIIEVNGFRGTVTQIGIRTTSVKDGGDNIKIFNNSEIKNVLNCSSNNSVAVCEFPISYNTDLEEAEKVLKETLVEISKTHGDIFEEINYVGVDKLGDNGIILKVVGKTDEKNVFTARRILNREVYLVFNKNKIENPLQEIYIHNN